MRLTRRSFLRVIAPLLAAPGLLKFTKPVPTVPAPSIPQKIHSPKTYGNIDIFSGAFNSKSKSHKLLASIPLELEPQDPEGVGLGLSHPVTGKAVSTGQAKWYELTLESSDMGPIHTTGWVESLGLINKNIVDGATLTIQSLSIS